MKTHDPLRRRRRTALSVVAGGLSALTLFAMAPVSPAGAAVLPPEVVTVTTPAQNTVRVAWTAPVGGEEPIGYRVQVDGPDTDTDGDGPDVDADLMVQWLASTARVAVVGGLPASTEVSVIVCPRAQGEDEVSPETEVCSTPVTATTLAPPPVDPGPPVSEGPFRPFFTVDAFIRQNYADWLDRAPRLDELNFWRSALGPAAGDDALTREEFLTHLRTTEYVDGSEAQVIRLYRAYFLRQAEFSGFDYWRNEIRDGDRSIRNVSQYFANSAEFDQRYGDLDDAEFVSLVYRNVLGRNPEATGFSFWTRQLDSGLRTRGEVMLNFSESSEYKGLSERLVLATEIYGDMLNRVPTPAELSPFALLGGSLADVENAIYVHVMSLPEYLNRVSTGAPA